MPVKTEKEKMLAGETYNCLDPDLEAERQKTKELLRLYNLTAAVPERQTILQQLLGQIGHGSIIEPPFYCSYGQNIYIGDHVYLNVLCTILDCNEVHIGHHVMIGPAVQIYTAAHLLQAETLTKAAQPGLPPTRLSRLEFERCNPIVECCRQKGPLQTHLAGEANRQADKHKESLL